MTTIISNLPRDLLENILSRVPLTHLKAIRSTCKRWNALSKDRSFANQHINKATTRDETQFLMITSHSVFLIGVNLHVTRNTDNNNNNNVDLSIEIKSKLTCEYKSHKVLYDHRYDIIHCKGLFLSVLKNMLVVWNPYYGKRKCITTRHNYASSDMYALGYDESCDSHKILRLFGRKHNSLEIYDLSSSSWMVPDATFERNIDNMQLGVSLKGNTYWHVRDEELVEDYLLCFDFTRERFGPRLSLPFGSSNGSLSSDVKEEKLAMLVHKFGIIEIWITSKIEPDEVSWINFLNIVDPMPMPFFHFGTFLVDEEKKIAVRFCNDKGYKYSLVYDTAYIMGENGYNKRVDLRYTPLCPFMCSYVPSSVQI